MLIPDVVPNLRIINASSGVGRKSGNTYVLIPFAAKIPADNCENSFEKCLGSCAITIPLSIASCPCAQIYSATPWLALPTV